MPESVPCPQAACPGLVSPSGVAKCSVCGSIVLNGSTDLGGITLPAGPGDPFPILPADFDRYRILSKLGRGGMGTVYLAYDRHLDRPVALKMPNLGPDDPLRTERFLREARASAGLQHPNLCTVYDTGTIAGRPFLTMRYVDGTSLDKELTPDTPMAVSRAIGLVVAVARAVAVAHAAGVVHRDLKPANIILTPNGDPVVMDFGLAKRMGDDDSAAKLTHEGAILGTPSYMSPEQARGEGRGVGPAADIYSLGAVVFECLTGRPPYVGSLASVLGQILTAPVPPLREFRPDAVPGLEAVINAALAKDPAKRYPTMSAFADALEGCMVPTGAEPIPRRLRRMIIAGAAILIAAAVTLVFPRGTEVPPLIDRADPRIAASEPLPAPVVPTAKPIAKTPAIPPAAVPAAPIPVPPTAATAEVPPPDGPAISPPERLPPADAPVLSDVTAALAAVTKGNWSTALADFASCGDALWARAAQLDRAGPKTAEEWLALGDAWRAAAGGLPPVDSAAAAVLRRAAECTYRGFRPKDPETANRIFNTVRQQIRDPKFPPPGNPLFTMDGRQKKWLPANTSQFAFEEGWIHQRVAPKATAAVLDLKTVATDTPGTATVTFSAAHKVETDARIRLIAYTGSGGRRPNSVTITFGSVDFGIADTAAAGPVVLAGVQNLPVAPLLNGVGLSNRFVLVLRPGAGEVYLNFGRVAVWARSHDHFTEVSPVVGATSPKLRDPTRIAIHEVEVYGGGRLPPVAK